MQNMVTIITVTFNCKESIKETIESVLTQTFKNIEYLIIDGGSTDGTLDIISEYASKDTRITYISEVDDGIYDAMNKGISMARGEIINFLNAGDTLYKNTVVSEVVEFIYNYKVDIIYGDIIMKDQLEAKTLIYGDINSIALMRRKSICHQSIFAKKEVFKGTGKFNLKYKICSDRDWLIKAYHMKYKIKKINSILVNFDASGVSNLEKNTEVIKKERNEIMNKYFGIKYKLWIVFSTIKNSILK